MTARRRAGAALAAVAAALLAAPATAGAHAALLRTSPSAGGVVEGAPARVALTYSEAVEPRFAIVSVTDAAGRQQTSGGPRRSPADPDQLVVPLRQGLARGWYLVYWRAISADGHPVRGAFTFAVGPNPGPAPQFAIPSLSETAATPGLLASRWIVFVAAMAALGLLVFRLLIARVVMRRVPGASLRGASAGFAISMAVALIAVPVYLDLATAEFALRSPLDLGAVVPLMRASAFGRGYLDLELALGLLAVAGAAAIALDRPERELRSVAEVLALAGALGAAAGVLMIPGLAGHAAQFSPRGLAVAMDWAHLVAGSVWIGGLMGLGMLAVGSAPGLRVRVLAVAAPRFSAVALSAVLALVASGTVASLTRFPTPASVWSTGYGRALLAKIALLAVALALAAVNRLRTCPRLVASPEDPAQGASAAALLRRLVAGEAALVVAAIFAAAVLSSLPPPASALGRIGHAQASVGPGPVVRRVRHGPYELAFRIAPNRAAVPNSFGVTITRDGVPVRGADVVARFDMLDMEMGEQAYRLAPRGRALYARAAPSLVMVGHWALTFSITPPGAAPFDVLLIDKADG